MGYFYTSLQFILLALIFFTPPFLPETLAGQVVLSISIVFGIWAVWAFRHTRINVFPYLREGSQLIKAGPYRFVRHPMYSAVLLFALSYLVGQGSWIYLVYFVAIVSVMVFKIRFEESQLAEHFQQYETHFYKTYRLVPCIY